MNTKIKGLIAGIFIGLIFIDLPILSFVLLCSIGDTLCNHPPYSNIANIYQLIIFAAILLQVSFAIFGYFKISEKVSKIINTSALLIFGLFLSMYLANMFYALFK